MSEAKSGARSEATSKRGTSKARRRSVSILVLAVASLQASFAPAPPSLCLTSQPAFIMAAQAWGLRSRAIPTAYTVTGISLSVKTRWSLQKPALDPYSYKDSMLVWR